MNYRLAFFFLLAPLALPVQNGPAVSNTGTPLPAWRAFFHHVQNLQIAAQTANAADAAALGSWQQTKIGLTVQEAAQVQQVAATHIAAVSAIDKQATQLIQAQATQFPGATLPSKGALPAPLPQLGQLQQQRDAQTLSDLQSLQAGLSAGSFTKLDAWIKSNFSQQIKRPAPSNIHPPAQASQGGNQ